MAWDLWSSSYDLVVHDGNYPVHPGLQGDYFFDCEHDLIEEDSLNEKLCVRVLRVLITKADTEIEELERDLLSLQNELAWAEHEKWQEICCNALTEKINWLEDAMRTLKNDNVSDIEMKQLLHDKPAETLNEILKAFQRDHCQDTYGQHLDSNILNPSLVGTEHAPEEESSNVDSNVIMNGGEELSGTSENSRSSKLLLELQEKRSDDLEKIELSDVDIQYPFKDASKDVMSLSIEKKQSNIPCMTSSLVFEEDSPILDPDGMNLCLVVIPEEKKPDPSERAKESLAKSLARSPFSQAISCAPVHSDEMQLLGTSDNNITGNEEVSRRQLITSDTGRTFNLFSSKVNKNIPREVKQENTILNENGVSSDALMHATGITRRKKCLASRLGASQQQKTGNSDLDKRLCDFAPKTVRRGCKKEPEVTLAEDSDSTTLQVVYPQDLCLADTEIWSIKKSNGKNSRILMNIQNVSLIQAENSASVSELDMQIKSALYGSHLTDEEKPQARDQKSKFAANLRKSNMSFSSKLKTQGKRKPELKAFSAREPYDSPVEIIPNTSISGKPKRQRKSRTSTDGASSHESMNRKFTKRTVQPGQRETEDRAIVPYDSKFSELQKRRVSKPPITMEIENSTVNLVLPNSDRISMGNGSQVHLQISKSHSLVESHDETSALLPMTLKKLTLTNLRSIAKQHNIRKYYKLTKAVLVEQLVERLGSC